MKPHLGRNKLWALQATKKGEEVNSSKESSIKKIYQKLFRIIPKNHIGDHFVAFINFVRLHKRLPTQRMLFNDVLYKIKTTSEIIDPLRIFVSDKEFVKIYVKAIVGDQFNVPTIKILNSIDDVKKYQFPLTCCIKPTHMSGEVILKQDDKPIDFERIERWLNTIHYNYVFRETNYKTLKPKVIVEPLVFNEINPPDYKIFCYMGKPKLIQVDIDRYINHTEKFYDLEWNEMPFSIHFPRSRRSVSKPKNLNKMLEVATLLCAHFNFVRIDMYSNGKECLVGEITNCPGGATGFVTNLYSNGTEYLDSELPNPKAEILASQIIFGDKDISPPPQSTH